MKQRHLCVFVMLASALAGCQQAANDTDIAVDNSVNADEVANADIETLPPSEEGGAPVLDSVGMPAALSARIPTQFHGRWGINRADCISTRGDAKGLLTINDARLTFYESRGTLGKVLGATAESFDANYGFQGEGQTWQRVERLKLVNDRLQRRTDAAAGQEPPVNVTYNRCSE